MRKQGIFLKYGIYLSLVRREVGDIDIVKQNASGIRLFKSADDSQRSRFAAAARTEQRNKFVFPDIERQVLYHFRVAVAFCDVE